MTPFSVASLSLVCLLLLLLPAQHDASSHASYMVGSRRIFFNTPGKSSGNSQQASTVPPATTCSSSIASGLGNNKIPVVHRQSPCSPLHGLPSLSAADVLRGDISRIRRRRFSSQSSVVAAPALALAPSPEASITFPVNVSFDPSTPGVLDFSVLVSYGTPEQQLPVFLDNLAGMSTLWCKPCPSGSDDCEPAFDTLQSSTFTHIPCGSPDCPANCSGSVCPLVDPHTSRILGTFSRDVLTLAPSTTVHDFRFVCIDIRRLPDDLPGAGWLDLSRDRNSLPSRLSSSSPTFSYCLPQYPDLPGYLFLGVDGTVGGDNRNAVHAPLVTKNDGNPEMARMYFIDLVGMSLGGEDLPILAESFGVNGTNLDTGTAITLLPPDAYRPLRDAFRKEMSQYNRTVAPFSDFDTCYNFTGLDELAVPLVRLMFSNGESLVIDVDQMLYYDDPAAAPFTVACFAFSDVWMTGDEGSPYSVIGTYTLASTEVVYDVAGGKVGFIPRSC